MTTTDIPSARMPSDGARPAALRWYMYVMLASVLFVVAAGVAKGFGSPPLVTADETGHLDYAYQLWHGHLPVFEDGVVIAPPFGDSPPVQWVAQHPPLFYAIMAPIVGPLIDGGHYFAAVMAGRSVNAVIAGAVVFCVWWAARRMWPRNPAVAAVSSITAGMMGMIVLVGGAIYNDLITVVFAALALGLAATVIRDGLRPWLVAGLALVAAGGMLSRLSFGVFVVAIVAAIIVAPSTHRWPRAWAVRIASAAIVGGAAVLASGWFYLRNIALTGNVSGGHPEWSQEHLGRRVRAVSDVVLDPEFWGGLFSLYRYNLPRGWLDHWVLLLVPVLLAATGAVWAIRRMVRARSVHRAEVWIGLMLLGVFAATLLLQVQYVAGGGGANTRYTLPLVPIIAPIVAYGLTTWRRGASVLTGLWVSFAFLVYRTTIHVDYATSSAWASGFTRVAFLVSAVAAVSVIALFAVGHHEEWRDRGIRGIGTGVVGNGDEPETESSVPRPETTVDGARATAAISQI
ncbi:hypothetical protein WJX64_08490 [Leifsonia sp. YIM 134122]|uniref:Glycosyltransferase RgtA/B/C/D-like domain-containing protein n=1 Tax=Leifsonia stereocauli TaxID=3134136 RepID=A0ABU9W3M4_9MICO